jgi:poly(A) polymerase
VILTPDHWRDMPGLPALLDVLGAADGDTRFVGGFVRDRLLGLPSADVDLATRLLPEEVLRRLGAAGLKAVPTGLAHGTVTAVIGGAPVEVTTLRLDVSTDGRHAEVAFTDAWQEDAARRDFTINALFADPTDGRVADFFGGLDDLDARRVRFIGEPLRRIAEDHLRILRFFRFHARFGAGPPDPDGLDACRARANDLMALSRERIADEVLKLLALPDPASTVRTMLAAGIFAPVLPEIDEAGALRLERVIDRERLIGAAAGSLRRLAALLPRDPALAGQVGARLKLSNQARSRLQLYATALQPEDSARRLRASRSQEEVVDLLLLSDAGPERLRAEIAAVAGGWTPPAFPLKGGDLVQLGLRPGPLVARTLAELRESWLDDDFPPEAAMRERARLAVDQALREADKNA